MLNGWMKSCPACCRHEVISGQQGFIVRPWCECQCEEINLTCTSLGNLSHGCPGRGFRTHKHTDIYTLHIENMQGTEILIQRLTQSIPVFQPCGVPISEEQPVLTCFCLLGPLLKCWGQLDNGSPLSSCLPLWMCTVVEDEWDSYSWR